jgi:O-antigen/teichoic acid export membrane protein
MNTVQRIAKNSLVLLTSNIISKILGFFYVMYIARYLGVEGFGILSLALAFTGIFGVFTDLGLDTLTVREVARDKSLASKYLGNIAVMKIFLVIITFALIALTINLLGYPQQTIKIVYLVALSVVFGAFSSIFNSIFQAYEKMEYQSLGQILSSVLMLSGALFAISHGLDVIGFASIYFLVSAVILGYSFAVYTWKFSLPKIEIDFNFWKSTIKEALPFGLTGFLLLFIIGQTQ